MLEIVNFVTGTQALSIEQLIKIIEKYNLFTTLAKPRVRPSLFLVGKILISIDLPTRGERRPSRGR
jgi:hypothetical protein